MSHSRTCCTAHLFVERTKGLCDVSHTFALLFVAALLLVGIGCAGNDPTLPSVDPRELTIADNGAYYVNASTLNVRAAPAGRLMGTLRLGQRVTVYATEEGWGRVSGPTQTPAWIAMQHLSRTRPGRQPIAKTAPLERTAPASIARGRHDSPGLGVSFDQALRGLDRIFTMSEATPTDGSARHLGLTADNLARLELLGDKRDLGSATLTVAMPPERDDVTTRSQSLLLTFAENVAPEADTSWLTAALEEGAPRRKLTGGKSLSLSFLDGVGIARLEVSPATP